MASFVNQCVLVVCVVLQLVGTDREILVSKMKGCTERLLGILAFMFEVCPEAVPLDYLAPVPKKQVRESAVPGGISLSDCATDVQQRLAPRLNCTHFAIPQPGSPWTDKRSTLCDITSGYLVFR